MKMEPHYLFIQICAFPDEFRRFAVIGTKGMVEGDFVRGFVKAHDSSGKKNI